METDLRPENSWRAAEKPDRHVPLNRRGPVRLWPLPPSKPVL